MGKINTSCKIVLRAKFNKQKLKHKRAKMGRLSDNRVTPGVVIRYKTAVMALLSFFASHHMTPTSLVNLDASVAEFVEAMWCEGEPHATATDALAGLQYFVPQVRKNLYQSWRLLKVWAKKEPPKRALPMHPVLLLGMAGMFAYIGCVDCGAVLLVGFDTMMRSGELYNLCVKDVSFAKNRAILKLRDTKTSSRKGGDEMVVVESAMAVAWLRKACANKPPDAKVLAMGPYQRRSLFYNFKELLNFLLAVCVFFKAQWRYLKLFETWIHGTNTFAR